MYKYVIIWLEVLLMRDVYLKSYSVSGIKCLSNKVTLSFYNKTLNSKDPDTQRFNVKGIYAINGSGKSAIISSVVILKRILLDPDFLNDQRYQEELRQVINKKINTLNIEIEFLYKKDDELLLYVYEVTLSSDKRDRYEIVRETLSFRNALNNYGKADVIFSVVDGSLDTQTPSFDKNIYKSTINLLSTASLSSLMMRLAIKGDVHLEGHLKALLMFAGSLDVYLESSDEHQSYIIFNELLREKSTLVKATGDIARSATIMPSKNFISKDHLHFFEEDVEKLKTFLQVFKSELRDIEVEKTEVKDTYICDLYMVYDDYRIDAEYESTGIKKLIKLYSVIRNINNGGIAFIDELDSNLHDVYLCALLDYLMEYGEGQLCFTTHNVGPMDILKSNKRSIDFLSEDLEITSWKNNGNYSPSSLYRSGMIKGSPFNVDATSFIGVLD